jgi:predicted nucleotidyltransferase
MMGHDATTVLEKVCVVVTSWSHRKSDIHGVALVGSWARDAARVDSDIDLVFLATDPQSFRNVGDWLQEIEWHAPITKWADVSYGNLWSRHCELADHTRIELGFASRNWASCSPIEAGTARVIRDGCRVLYDPVNLFERLCKQVAQ